MQLTNQRLWSTERLRPTYSKGFRVLLLLLHAATTLLMFFLHQFFFHLVYNVKLSRKSYKANKIAKPTNRQLGIRTLLTYGRHLGIIGWRIRTPIITMLRHLLGKVDFMQEQITNRRSRKMQKVVNPQRLKST